MIIVQFLQCNTNVKMLKLLDRLTLSNLKYPSLLFSFHLIRMRLEKHVLQAFCLSPSFSSLSLSSTYHQAANVLSLILDTKLTSASEKLKNSIHQININCCLEPFCPVILVTGCQSFAFHCQHLQESDMLPPHYTRDKHQAMVMEASMSGSCRLWKLLPLDCIGYMLKIMYSPNFFSHVCLGFLNLPIFMLKCFNFLLNIMVSGCTIKANEQADKTSKMFLRNYEMLHPRSIMKCGIFCQPMEMFPIHQKQHIEISGKRKFR